VQACGLSSYLTCAVYDDTLALKNELAAALDAEMLLTTDDNLYQALGDARAAMWEDLTARSRDSARLSTITPPEVTPMLAIAYDYYEDAGRDGEIIARNKIHHPSFVPVKNLLVLSR
jgi:prophage DNA circulation protein